MHLNVLFLKDEEKNQSFIWRQKQIIIKLLIKLAQVSIYLKLRGLENFVI